MTTPEIRRDAYAEAQRIQNSGEPCPHCGARSGHFFTCLLISNPIQAKQIAAEQSSIDNFFLKSLRIEAL
jgi:hypothetical protein